MTSAPEGRGPETEGAVAVIVSVDGDVGTVTLRRRPHNLLTEPVLRELAALV